MILLKYCLLSFIYSLSILYVLLPFRIRFLMGQGLGAIACGIFKFRRFTILKNITIVYPQWSKEQKLKFSKLTNDWLGYQVLEIFRVPLIGWPFFSPKIRIENPEYYQAAKEQSKNGGVFLLTCHIGNTDLGLKALASHGYPIWAISKQLSHGLSNQVWFKLRSFPGLNFIEAHGRETAFKIFKALGQGGAVVFVLDQFMSYPYGIPSRFFNRLTGTAFGLVRFFTKNQSPILPCYTYQDNQGTIVVTFCAPIQYKDLPTQALNESTLLQAQVEYLNQHIESMILKVPEQWMWIHRRWKRWKKAE